MARADVSVLIVSYNTREMTVACLASLFEQSGGLSCEVIVADNASTDGSPDAIRAAFPSVQLISLRENVGFGRANNIAAERASGRYLLLLNPDTVVLDGAIQKLFAFAEAHPAAGICGGRTILPDGSANPLSCRRYETPWSLFCVASGLAALFKRSRLFSPHSYGGFAQDRVLEVDIVHGSFLLIRREIWDSLGGFDPLFFMYGEEVDLCLRAKKAGYRCVFTPAATIIHYGGASETVLANKQVRLLTAKVTNIRRHWKHGAARWGVVLLEAWVLRCFLAASVLALAAPKRFRQIAQEMRRVWQRRQEWTRGYTPDVAEGAAAPELAATEARPAADADCGCPGVR